MSVLWLMLRRLVILPPLLLHPPWKCQPSGIGKEYLSITRKIMLTLQTLWKDLWEDTRNTQTILFKLLQIKSIYFILVLFGGQLLFLKALLSLLSQDRDWLADTSLRCLQIWFSRLPMLTRRCCLHFLGGRKRKTCVRNAQKNWLTQG